MKSKISNPKSKIELTDARSAARHATMGDLCLARDRARDQGKTSLQRVLQAEINKRMRAGQ